MIEAKEVENMIRDGMRDAIKSRLSNSYGSPMDKLIGKCIDDNADDFRKLMNQAIASCMNDAQFREDICKSVRHTLAKTLIARFGGEMEKQVNALKSDPTTRARITLAIEDIVKTQAK